MFCEPKIIAEKQKSQCLLHEEIFAANEKWWIQVEVQH